MVVWVLGCQSSAPAPEHRARAAPPAASCKPEAPVAIEIATRAIGSELEVTARATPTRDATSLELQLALPAHAQALGATSTRFAATPAGVARVITTRIRIDQRTSAITAIARVPVAADGGDDIIMARTATIEVGAPAAPPRTKSYALPDGDLAREVRP